MLQLIIASVQAILQVMTVVTFGFIFAKTGYFTMDKQKWLSKLNLMYFTPCLLFSNVASIISFEKLLAFWPIPVFYYTYSLVFYVVTQTSTRLVGLPNKYRRFVLACVMFQNTNSLPLAIISSLAVSEAASILFWNADDTPEAVAARGISYTLFFAIFGNLLRWSYGYQLLQHHEDDIVEIYTSTNTHGDLEHQQHPDLTVTSDRHPPSSSSSSLSAASDGLKAPTMPDRRYSSLTLTGSSPQDDLVKPSQHHHAMDETTTLLPKSHSNNNNNNSMPTFVKRLALRFHNFMTPPLYAALLALIVGLSPLKHLLYDKRSFLYPSFTKAIESCGKAAVPIILSCLGAQLASITSEQHTTSNRGATKAVTMAVVIRMVLTPLVVTPLVVCFVHYGAAYSMLATDPVFIVMMLVLGCTPTAINLVQIAQVNAIFEEEMLRMLFWSYGVVCVPVVTLVVFLALNVVDRLL